MSFAQLTGSLIFFALLRAAFLKQFYRGGRSSDMSLCMPPLTAERFGKAIRNALASNQTRSNPSALGSVRLVSSKRGGSSSRYLQRQRNDPFVKQRLNLGHSPRRRVSDGEGCTDDAVGPSAANTYISRSAFKLLQLDDKYKFLRAGRTIIDLGAAPGGWSQVVVERIARDRDRAGREHDAAVSPVFALDILPMASIEGVTCLQGDFLDPAIQARLRQKVAQTSGEASSESFVDVVVSDMMSNTSGNSIADTEASLSLCQAAYVSSFVRDC